MKGDPFLDSVLLLGPAQLTPPLFGMYRRKLCYFKRGGGTVAASLKDLNGAHPQGAEPTCTNAALALAVYWQVDTLILFGMDFGFVAPDHHHSKASVYYAHDSLKSDGVALETFRVPGVAGTSVSTTSLLFASKRNVEYLIHAARKVGQNLRVFNMSGGANIAGTEYVASVGALPFSKVAGESKESPASCKPDIGELLLSEALPEVDPAQLERALGSLGDQLEELRSKLLAHLRRNVCSVEHMTDLCHAIASDLEQYKQRGDVAPYMLMRGSIWHWLVLGFTHYCALPDSAQRASFADAWQFAFSESLEQMAASYSSWARESNCIEDDPKVTLSISEMIMGELAANLEWVSAGFRFDFESASYAPEAPTEPQHHYR
jgi:hypothetical protein